ncbi:MAG: hypothetical protein ACREJD_05355 [Phycisphaerales bacterium]
MRTKTAFALMSGLAAACSSTNGAPPVIYNLGIYPGGTESHGSAVSNDATYVTGYGDFISGTSQFFYAFRWSIPGGLVNLGAPASISFTAANSMDSAGLGVAGNGANKLFRWTVSGGMQSLGLLPGAIGGGLATGISGDTSIVVGWSGSNTGTVYGVRWTSSGGIVALPSLPAGAFGSSAYGISADGSTIVGGSSWSGSGYHACRWLPGNIVQDLGALPTSTDSRAFAISKNNAVIVGDCQMPSGDRAFRYSNASMQNLGTPLGTTASYGRGTNYDGKVVTGRAAIGPNNYRALYWSTNVGMKDFATYVTSLGANLTGWVLEESWGVSNDGSAIAGTGTFNGLRRAYLIKGLPCPSVATVVTDPVDISICPNTTASAALSLTVDAPGDVTYQWSVESPADSGVFVPIEGPSYSDPTGLSFEVAGWNGPELVITGARAAVQVKEIRFIPNITNPCGTTTSSVARVVLCRSDLTCDGMVDDSDFVDFAVAYDALVCPGGTPGSPPFCPGDLNQDNQVDDADFVIFATAYDALLCV